MRLSVTGRGAAGELLALMLLAGAGVLAVPATAAMAPVPLGQSIQRSDLVIRGRTLDQHCEWSSDGRWIVTYVRIQVLETLGGTEPNDEVIVRVLGGALEGRGLVVSEMPVFQADEEAVLFLKRARDGSSFLVTDNFQGKNTLLGDRVVERDLSRDDFLTQVRDLARDLPR